PRYFVGKAGADDDVNRRGTAITWVGEISLVRRIDGETGGSLDRFMHCFNLSADYCEVLRTYPHRNCRVSYSRRYSRTFVLGREPGDSCRRYKNDDIETLHIAREVETRLICSVTRPTTGL